MARERNNWPILIWLAFQVALLAPRQTMSFSIILMGAQRGKGKLQRSLDNSIQEKRNNNIAQELTGVTLPEEGKLKGWEFGNNQRIACANIGGRYYGIQGSCPRCAFDLWKGTLVKDDDNSNVKKTAATPIVACPTCSTTYSLITGKHGSPLKRSGLAGFVGGLALTATLQDAAKDAKVYTIATEEDRIFCRER